MTPLPDYETALQRILEDLAPLPETEEVDLADAAGRVLSESVRADRDLPPFNRAQMDGYALRAAEVGMLDAWTVAGHLPAGASWAEPVPPGSCVSIATGAPVPDDVDTVVQHELSDRQDPVHLTIDSIEAGHAIHPRGADARAGDRVIEPGTLLGAHHLGIAASVGVRGLSVTRRPRAAIISSGDEVVPIEQSPRPCQIRNSNGPQMTELLRRLGAEPLEVMHVPDELDRTIETVGSLLDRVDLLVTIGGISVGARDHFPAAFESCQVSALVRGAAIQPGRPVFIGRGRRGVTVVGLPGNPVSALVCGCLFLPPLLRRLLGLADPLPWQQRRLTEPVRPNPARQAFRPARLVGFDGVLVPAWAGSGDLAHTATTHGILELPVQAEPVDAGTTLRFLPWP